MSCSEKRQILFKWAVINKIDILCLQETFCTENKLAQFNKDWTGFVYHAPSDSPHSRGVATLINKDVNFELITIKKSDDGRKLLLTIKIDEKIYNIFNIYAPNNYSEKLKFYKKCDTWISQNLNDNSNIIFCGDFNCTLKDIDRNNLKVDKESKHLHKILKKHNLTDTFRFLNKDKIEYTYHNKDITSQSRIDYIFPSSLKLGSLRHSYITSVPGIPDHRAMISMFNNDYRKGPGYWKLNTDLLGDG